VETNTADRAVSLYEQLLDKRLAAALGLLAAATIAACGRSGTTTVTSGTAGGASCAVRDQSAYFASARIVFVGIMLPGPAVSTGQGTKSRPALAAVYCLVTVDIMNEDLLAEARQAQERLIDAECDADVARAEFYRAVRRLHLHGSSLRELAASLGLSHQRVYQIVEEAGGSRRWLRARGSGRPVGRKGGQPDPTLLACTFCGKNQKQVRKLIAGPYVYICDGCVDLVKNVTGDGQDVRTALGPISAVPEAEHRIQCSFCGKNRKQVSGLAVMPTVTAGKGLNASAAICSECLDLCDEIVAEELT
jgi:hypothetical protein